ncbi:hypothetical protein NW760_006703 [Fusarium oxysporum]|uniref:Uncharacterized protein n=1 Tax=Fusarium oxysporum f. sp. pisi HDV247 TaxID=1080344 RepID=W9Q289_FUSOX|nr:hypothetical protein FOVG_00183 [Fusarium oxysporum f. sp. pisi HDV247]KAJ4111706.1 hypothetical protein NW769_006424 [Fusarium oxysporum]KAJ4230293.1 hypothetical protein NW760_006703 [Fusarium oxysporum]WKT39904.1 hypothetical protein QSH57_001723 [Fusarium oxysporum f. sp. vasinfectum]
MKTISYVINPDGYIELVLREPNSHQIIPEIYSDDCSTHTDLPNSDFDNPPATGRYTISNELYTKSTTATGTQKVEEDHEPIHTIGWGAVALAIVLDAIHGRHAEIPRVINLGLLARIATVVDYYKCKEAIHILFGYWQRNIIR